MTIKMRLIDKPDTIKKIEYPFIINPNAAVEAIEASGNTVVEYNVRLATNDDYKRFKVRDYQQTIEGYRKILRKMGVDETKGSSSIQGKLYDIRDKFLKATKEYEQFCERNGVTQELIEEEALKSINAGW